MLWSNWLSRSRKTGDNFYSNANSFEWIKFMNEMGSVCCSVRARIYVCARAYALFRIFFRCIFFPPEMFSFVLIIVWLFWGFVLCSCFYFFAGRDRSSIMTSLLFFTVFFVYFELYRFVIGDLARFFRQFVVVWLSHLLVYIYIFFYYYFRALIEFNIGFNWCINVLQNIQTCTNRWYNRTLDTQE